MRTSLYYIMRKKTHISIQVSQLASYKIYTLSFAHTNLMHECMNGGFDLMHLQLGNKKEKQIAFPEWNNPGASSMECCTEKIHSLPEGHPKIDTKKLFSSNFNIHSFRPYMAFTVCQQKKCISYI